MAVEKAVLMSTLSAKGVLTFQEAVVYSGISPSYLYKMTSTGQVPHSKPLGKMVYFNRLELEEWLLQNKVTTDAELKERAMNHCFTKTGRV